jgi:hypothetical protein
VQQAAAPVTTSTTNQLAGCLYNGIRSLVPKGSRVGPLSDSVALPPLPTTATLTLKLFRGKRAISTFDDTFNPPHRSSPSFSTLVSSDLDCTRYELVGRTRKWPCPSVGHPLITSSWNRLVLSPAKREKALTQAAVFSQEKVCLACQAMPHEKLQVCAAHLEHSACLLSAT